MNDIQNTQHRTITCKCVTFYCYVDEDIFFEWLGKITCIKKIHGMHDELYLDIVNRDLTDDEVTELCTIFDRYKIAMTQLQPFIPDVHKHVLSSKWKRLIYK